MSLKLTRGLSSLSNLPPRVKVITLVFLILMASVTLFSERSSLSSIGEPLQSSSAALAKADSVLPQTARTAKIITCPRCRLNALPLVKKFVYEHAKLFEPALKVEFILGEDPVLHLYESGKAVRTIPLDEYDSGKIIRTLVQFGIKPTSSSAVVEEALRDV